MYFEGEDVLRTLQGSWVYCYIHTMGNVSGKYLLYCSLQAGITTTLLQTTCFKARDHLVHSRHFGSLSTMVCRQCQHSLKQIYPRFTVETVKGGRSLRDDMDCKKSTALPSARGRTVRNTPASVCSSRCFKTVKICTAASRNESLNEA